MIAPLQHTARVVVAVEQNIVAAQVAARTVSAEVVVVAGVGSRSGPYTSLRISYTLMVVYAFTSVN